MVTARGSVTICQSELACFAGVVRPDPAAADLAAVDIQDALQRVGELKVDLGLAGRFFLRTRRWCDGLCAAPFDCRLVAHRRLELLCSRKFVCSGALTAARTARSTRPGVPHLGLAAGRQLGLEHELAVLGRRDVLHRLQPRRIDPLVPAAGVSERRSTAAAHLLSQPL